MKFNLEAKQKQVEEALLALKRVIFYLDDTYLEGLHVEIKLIEEVIKHSIANEMALESLKERMLNAVLDERKAHQKPKKTCNEETESIGGQPNIDFPAPSRTVDARAHYRG